VTSKSLCYDILSYGLALIIIILLLLLLLLMALLLQVFSIINLITYKLFVYEDRVLVYGLSAHQP